MKKTNFFYRSAMFFGAIGLLFTSCEPTTVPGIEVDKNAPAIEILATGAAVDYTFTANEAWTATADQTWVTVTPASGKGGGKATVSISAEVYEALTENRTANVTFKAGETTISVKVTQFSALPAITFTPEEVAIKSNLKDVVSVTSNVEYVVIAKPEWLDITLPTTMTGTHDVALEVNSVSDEDRSGEFTLAKTGTTVVLATIPVSVKKTLAATTTMLNPNFAANQFYVMPTHSDIKIEGMEDGAFRLVGIELTGTTLGTAEVSWLTFEKNTNFTQTLVYKAKVANYTSKTATRSARIFIAPIDFSNEQILAAGDKFKVSDIKQFPDAVQFGWLSQGPSDETPEWNRSLDIKFSTGGVAPNPLFTVEANGFSFKGTHGRALNITDKNTYEQAEAVPVRGTGLGVNDTGVGKGYPKLYGMLGMVMIGGAGYTNYYGATVVVDGVDVEGLFLVVATHKGVDQETEATWSNDVPETK